MEEKFITLNKSEILKVEIRDCEGVPTGDYLEFDLEDIELPLKYSEIIERTEKNKIELENKLTNIKKQQDVEGKYGLTKNQKDEFEALKNFFYKQAEIYDILLGENGVNKLLCGRKLGWTTLKEIDEIIKNQLAKYLNYDAERVVDKIKKEYAPKTNENVLKAEDIQ